MLFKVEMKVHIPDGIAKQRAEELKAEEKAYSQALQQSGKWRHIWRLAGKYENISIFDVEDNNELHKIIISLPLFPFMEISIEPLCRHPSSIREDDK